MEPEPASPGPYHAVPEDGQDRGRVVVVPGAVPPPTEAWRAALASWLAAAWPVAGAAVPEALPGAAPVPASAAEARWLWAALARLGEAAVRLGRAVRPALTGEHLVPLLVALGDAAAAGRAPSRAALLAFGLPRLPLGQASTRAVQGMDTAVRTGRSTSRGLAARTRGRGPAGWWRGSAARACACRRRCGRRSSTRASRPR